GSRRSSPGHLPRSSGLQCAWFLHFSSRMRTGLLQLREGAKRCQDCPLWANATQTVFGAGDPHARVMLVGEQPGDEEDKKGLPFVGPAGRLLDKALAEAGVDREH